MPLVYCTSDSRLSIYKVIDNVSGEIYSFYKKLKSLRLMYHNFWRGWLRKIREKNSWLKATVLFLDCEAMGSMDSKRNSKTALDSFLPYV